MSKVRRTDLICSLCCSSDHAGHKVTDFLQAVDTLRKKELTFLEDAAKREEQHEPEMRKKLENELKKFATCADQVKKRREWIMNEFENILNKLEESRKEFEEYFQHRIQRCQKWKQIFEEWEEGKTKWSPGENVSVQQFQDIQTKLKNVSRHSAHFSRDDDAGRFTMEFDTSDAADIFQKCVLLECF